MSTTTPPSPTVPSSDGGAGSVLAYRSGPPDPEAAGTTEFDVELASERTRWIRRRFLWFCAVNVALLSAFFAFLARDVANIPGMAWTFNVLDFVVVCGGYVVAFVYVWRVPLSLARLLKLGIYLSAILPTLSVLFTRLDITLNPASYDFMGGSIEPGACWALLSPWSIFIGFTVACLFIPWTVREALRPAVVVVGANSLILIFDLLFTIRQPIGRYVTLACLAASPFGVVPGLLFRWWRFSRFRKFFPVLFESSGYRKLQTELAGARRLHEATLPPHDFHTRGPARLAYAYEPMRQIGGDVLYVHPGDQPDAARLSVVLVDVNGHGIPAALMANRLIGETQRLYAEDPDACPHKILCALNRYVRLTMARDGIYATALVVRLDTAAGTLEYANAGHPPALLRRAADGAVASLASHTFLLGVEDGDDYCPDCQVTPFAPGDALLAYTDGATEARNAAGEMIGIPGLRHLLGQLAARETPDRWPPSLLSLVVNHRRAPAADDTLLVTLHRP